MSERRSVEVARGHRVTVYRHVQQTTRPGYVTVRTSHRAPFDIEQRRWDDGRST